MTTVCFRVEGAFLVKIARERCWYDENRAGALDLLGYLENPENPTMGLSGECMKKVLDGDATLDGDSSVGVVYVEREDKDWKAIVEQRRDFFAQRAMRKADDLARRAEDLARSDQAEDLCAGGYSQFMSREPFTGQEKQVKLKGGKTIRVAGRRVPKDLLEQYVNVVRRIAKGAFLGVASEIANDPLAFFQLEERRVAIHDEIMKHLGLDRESEVGQEFSMALHEKYGLMGKEGGA